MPLSKCVGKTGSAKSRVLDEMIEMAQALQTHDLLSKQGMAKMKLICQAPPECGPERVAAIEIGKGRVV